METTSASTRDSLSSIGSRWKDARKGFPFRPLPAAIVACHPASVLLITTGLWTWGISLLLFSHAILLVGIFVPSASLFGRTHTRLPSPRGARPSVWLTIDDGPDPRTTPEILDVLDRHGVSATFFVIGEKAKRHPELLARIAARGHQLANHSTSHPAGTFWCMPPGRVEREIDETNRLIRALTGASPTWFRPPVGHQNPFLHPIADRHGMGVVTWSVSGWDGVAVSLERAVQRICRRLTPGTILVIHEGYDPKPRGYSPATLLERVLERIESDGYATLVPAARTGPQPCRLYGVNRSSSAM